MIINPYIFGGFDPDAQAFITAANITDNTQKTAINQLVLSLKANNIWSKMKAIYPFVGGTASTHKWNLKDPRDLDAAFRLVFNGGWTHSSTGALPNGTNAYADSKFIVTTNATASSHSYGIYSRTNNTSGSQAYGVYDNTNNYIQHNLTLPNFLSGDISAILTYTANPSTSLFIGTRRSLNNYQAYRGGSSLGVINVNIPSFTMNLPFYFGARNNSNTAALYTNHQLAFAFLGDSITDTDATNLYNTVQTFQTSLSRQV